MRFGRYRGETYEKMMMEFPRYCEWAIATAEQEPEAGVDLQHFASWLIVNGFLTEPRGSPNMEVVEHYELEETTPTESPTEG